VRGHHRWPSVCVGALAVLSTVVLAPPAQSQQDETFTIAVIPDTQIYVQSDAGSQYFRDQVEWIAHEQEPRNIVFATHVGDVAQNPSSVTEFDRIESIFAVLDQAEIPYGIAPGNHDINPDGSAPEYDARFGTARYEDRSWFAGNHGAEGNRSSFQTLSVEGHDLLFLHVRHLQPEYGDVDAVLAWAAQVLQDHPDHLVFVTTHEFTEGDGSVRKPALQAVVQDSCNVVAMFSGHRLAGAAAGSFIDACGRTVHHVLTNYQGFANGGNGYLRTVEIDRLTLDAEFQVYSPSLDVNRTGPAEQFTAPLAPLELVAGDASCNRQLTVADALFVAQYAVGLRTGRVTCPLPDPMTNANIASADVNNNGVISVADALFIAQCSVGLPNVACPG